MRDGEGLTHGWLAKRDPQVGNDRKRQERQRWRLRDGKRRIKRDKQR